MNPYRDIKLRFPPPRPTVDGWTDFAHWTYLGCYDSQIMTMKGPWKTFEEMAAIVAKDYPALAEPKRLSDILAKLHVGGYFIYDRLGDPPRWARTDKKWVEE